MLPLLIALLIAFAPAAVAQTLLTGQIVGNADERITIIAPTDLFGTTTEVQVGVADGRFAYTAKLPLADWLTVSYKDKTKRFFVWNSAKELHIAFDADFLDGDVTISGDGAAVHSFMTAFEKEFAQKLHPDAINGRAKDASNIDGLEMEAFRDRNAMIKALTDFNATTPLPSDCALPISPLPCLLTSSPISRTISATIIICPSIGSRHLSRPAVPYPRPQRYPRC